MDSFHYKTYVHILFSEENSLIYSYLEEVYFIWIASFQQAIPPTYFPYARWPQCDPSRKNPVTTIRMDVLKINYYLNLHVKHVLNFHAFLFIFRQLLTNRWQSLNFGFKTRTLITCHIFTTTLTDWEKKLTIIRNLHEKNDKFEHRRRSLGCLYALVQELEEHYFSPVTRFLWL